MGKLPRKEELLKSQQKGTPVETAVPESSKENMAIKKSKEEAEIAENQAKKAEAEAKIKLQEQGYKTLEQWLKDLEIKNQDIEKRLVGLQTKEASIANRLEDIEAEKDAIELEKEKIKNAYAINTQKETSAQVKLDEAIKLENKLNEIYAQTRKMKQEINVLINYYNTYISPCIKILGICVQSLDDIMVVLRYPKQYNERSLLRYILSKRNFIGKKCDALDRFIDASKQ